MATERLSIPTEIKVDIWKTRVGRRSSTYCENNCGRLIYMPESVRKKMAVQLFNRIPGYSNAEYGHIISDKNGGDVSSDNLMLLCVSCNRTASSANMYEARMPMYTIPSSVCDEDIDCFMDIEVQEGFCRGITTEGNMCKMKVLLQSKTCSVHQRQLFVNMAIKNQ